MVTCVLQRCIALTEPGLAERIQTLHICSDGAAAHFKQRGSLHYITGLSVKSRYNMTWTFGCPGHGKELGTD